MPVYCFLALSVCLHTVNKVGKNIVKFFLVGSFLFPHYVWIDCSRRVAVIASFFISDFLHVYEDKVEALKVVKHHKKARFKAFKQRSDAVAFAVHGADSLSTASEENAPVAPTVSQSDAEKPSLFKGPKQQDMVQLRRAIESGNLELVYKTVWDNPRFLISSGDTPSILQVFPGNSLEAVF